MNPKETILELSALKDLALGLAVLWLYYAALPFVAAALFVYEALSGQLHPAVNLLVSTIVFSMAAWLVLYLLGSLVYKFLG